MKTILEQITAAMEEAFEACGYESRFAKVSLSNRPDLCEYQCNGALAAAKTYHKAPIQIASDVAEKLQNHPMFLDAAAAAPGFLNLKLSGNYLAGYLNRMMQEERLGCEPIGADKSVIIDYGGPNVAKPLHVGHLRAAIIGESLKRIYRYNGYQVIGDVHLGDWGLQMGLIIEETRSRHPELPYFDEAFTGDYPSDPPFTISDLEEIYPTASAKAKQDETFAKAAHDATVKLQKGNPGYQAIFRHILAVSIADLKKNYARLKVDFDIWKGESDAQPYIPDMIEKMKQDGLLYESQGALVVDVKEDTDTKEIPPCIVQKSDGASLYATTDLATLVEREKLYHPDEVLYVVDKRQDMHFTQVFRTARKASIIRPETKLTFLGFGTMNGKDGKPFKTREGGVMRLEHLIRDINEAVYARIMENREISEEDAHEISQIIGLAALKYGDLSNQATKDYVFDVDRFTSFEGNTGPYILYTMVRIKSILGKYRAASGNAELPKALSDAKSSSEKELQLLLSRANDVIAAACAEIAPHRLCQYIYEVSNAFNKFYHETKILGEEDGEKQKGWIALLSASLTVLADCIDLLGFEAPEKM
ncbi:arginine--tRNA ligase [Hominifimenecus sp. rT4P-3]|uniref:arginine--tRNA ligase n=1 Tax=Hominifimenecus sp. rT4P-3 TaxID=3242979 RepID=UPI003DA5A23B